MRSRNDGVKAIVSRLTAAVDSIEEDMSEFQVGEIQGAMEDAITTIETMHSDMEDVVEDWK